MYSFTLSLTSAIDGLGGQRHAPAVLPPGKDPVRIVKEGGWAPSSVWTVSEILTPHRYSNPGPSNP